MVQKISLKEFIDKMKIEINDLTIKIFHFNPVQVNTLVVYDNTLEAVIVDPGNFTKREDQILSEYIEDKHLSIKYIINTHPHFDHILGNLFCVNQYQAPLLMHASGLEIYHQAPEYCKSFGFDGFALPKADKFVEENDEITFGNQCWKVLYTPGHADGSISLFDAKNKFVIVGDLLFFESVGRTDLPTGNASLLLNNIKNKILPLGDKVTIIPGHGFQTNIEHEIKHNPFLEY